MISKRRVGEIAHALHKAYYSAVDEQCTQLVVDAAYEISEVLKEDNPQHSTADFVKAVYGR